nr:MAG TPA: Gamma-aminobutyric acid type B receptor(B) receptor, coiled-coil, heterodimer, SIGNALING.62A [Bacteriophage sp.]
MKKSTKELQTENELLRATLALVMEKLKELTELLNGGCHE